ncbi:oligosaccharide flippase family protein [Lutibacter sp.]|uniref:lipopolysaccharide biosynthesis protein n=1 Tax=Lutibacter sp. TaxID=1925666 RepID=UPI0025C4BF55|nr:oligosaccharide flippase family protein [Lutibacter sp.]MCF6181005.1 oligosaccharide flippase family protein [Lutibacter sp.]
MGIVLKQSFKNTLILFLGFTIGAVNVLFLYTHFLQENYFGLVTFLLSSANILLPLVALGMQHTIIKFFSNYKSKLEKDSFLTTTLLLPLLVIIPLGIIGAYFYETIATWISSENHLIKKYTFLIFIIAVFMGYFEVFYAWTKVHFKSVFGNFIKEIFARVCVTILLFAVYFNGLSNEQFIYAIVLVYGIRTLIMLVFALKVYKPSFHLKLPKNLKEIVSFSIYILVAGSAAGILLEIDKFMIPQMEKISEVAYYAVGIYIASVIAIPTRAMQQITTPIVAKGMNENKIGEMANLYKQSSINLLVVGGLFFLLINLNINELYQLINKPQFTKGIWVVYIISCAKLIELALGTGNAILVNSKFYKVFFYISLAMALSVIALNHWLIAVMGINGAALATFIVVVFYGIFKIIFIKMKLNIQPFTVKTIKLIIVIIILFISFGYLKSSFNPLITIIVKSLIISILYLIIIKKLKISNDISELMTKYIPKR